MSRKIIGITVGSPLPKPNLKQTDPAKGDYVKGKDIIPVKVSQLENDAGYLDKHQDISGKLDASALPAAINSALAEAKASGEFKGDKGDIGDDYVLTEADKNEIAEMAAEMVEIPDSVDFVVQDTAPTDTSVMWVDTSDDTNDGFQEAVNAALAQAKASGEFDGEKGTSVSVKSVSESTTDGGSNVVTFSDGTTVTIKNGDKGAKPVKGTDYFTAADKTEMVNAVLAALPVYAGEVI